MENSPASSSPEAPQNAALGQLAILVGEWSLESSAMSFLDDPSMVAHASTSFEWLEDGKFLLQRSQAPSTEFPTSTSINGPDNEAGTYMMLYFDSRGVSRLYQMSLREGVWKLWRDFPGSRSASPARSARISGSSWPNGKSRPTA